jgi:uncharacterized Zn-finger protein
MADPNGSMMNQSSMSNKRKYESEDEEEDDSMKSSSAMTFSCIKCHATFVTKMSLARHLILHEDEQNGDEDEYEEDDDEREQHLDIRVKADEDLLEVQNEHEAEGSGDDAFGKSNGSPSMLESLLQNGSTSSIRQFKREAEDPLEERPVLVTPTPAKIPKMQNGTSRPIPNLKPLPSLIPTKDFQMVQKRDFQCELCFVYFSKKEDLARHVTRTHGGARFTCPYCSRNISRRDHLKRHIKNVCGLRILIKT